VDTSDRSVQSSVVGRRGRFCSMVVYNVVKAPATDIFS
jgi:hypothetical protein